ncbi:MAG: serine protease AprX [Frankiaceae bacterium]|nr:serine protease AprX [Frankiaceae bacterium]
MHPRCKAMSLAGLVPALAIAATVAAVPASAASRRAPHIGSDRLVNAVVVVRSGVTLPLRVPGGRVLAQFAHVGSELVRAPMSVLAALAADPRVAGVSPDRPGRVMGHDYSGDNDKGNGHGSRPDSVFASDGLGNDAGRSDTGRGVNVALLDTGVSDTAALNRASGRITDGVDVSHLASGGAARTSGQFTDGYGHGTFLASLIAGGRVTGSGGQALGVAPAARIVVVKVADDDGITSLSQVLAGMDWVASHARAIQVVNLALAVDRPTAPAYGADPLTAAVEHVRATGVLVVAAAGNTPGQVGDPGMDPQALTVGAADLTSRSQPVASFSGSGVVAGVAKPDLVASGVHLLGLLAPDSAIARANPSGWQSNGLFRGSGTSESTAVAAGVAAAWFSDHPGAAPLTAKTALRNTAVGGGRSNPRAGAGLVQLANGNGHGNDGRSGDSGESGFDSTTWQANAWQQGNWASWLASSWSGPAWTASSWSASSWSASSWSASSWSASSWSDYGWGDDG